MKNEQGSALVLAVFVLVLLTGLGTALLFLSQNELKTSRANLQTKQAFYLAEAGLENGRMELFNSNGNGTFGDDLIAVAGGDGTLGFDPETVTPVFDVNGELSGFAGIGDDVPLTPLTPFGTANDVDGWFAAFLTNDPVEMRNTPNTTDGDDRVMLNGVGVGPGGSMEVVQAIIEPLQPLPVVPTAAITMIGRLPAFDNGSSNAQSHTGTDCPLGGGIPGLYVPIVGTTESAAKTQVEGDMSRPANFSSGLLSGADTVGNLVNTLDPAMAQSSLPPLDPSWLDCNHLTQVVQSLIADADYYCNTDSGSCTTPVGNAGDIVVIDGDATAGSFSAGLLLVTGELTYSGNSAWHGIVMVIGEGRLDRDGGGNGHNSGAVILANIDPSPGGARADKSDWCSSGFLPTSFSVNGAGTSTLSFCTDDVSNNNPVTTYRVTEFLQH